MFVLAFKTIDDREREVEFDDSDEAIARMEDIPITCSNTRMCTTRPALWLRNGDAMEVCGRQSRSLMFEARGRSVL